MTKGQELLIRATGKHGEKSRLARAAGVKINQISQWARGTVRPSAQNRARLRVAAKIPFSAWDEPVEEK